MRQSQEEGKNGEFRADVRKCFFLQKLRACGLGPGSAADLTALDPLQELSNGREVKEHRANEGWVSVACWSCCPALSYLKHIQVCFELSFDISLQLQKASSEGM